MAASPCLPPCCRLTHSSQGRQIGLAWELLYGASSWSLRLKGNHNVLKETILNMFFQSDFIIIIVIILLIGS